MVQPVFPIVDEPALLVNFSDKKILCISDLHLGYEFLLAQKGVVIPSQAEEMKYRILNLIERTNADNLIIIGDVKHNIFRVSQTEWRGVTRLLEDISKKVDVQITLGNHDTNLDLLLPKNTLVHSSKGFLIENDDIKIGFIHGHAWPKPDLLQADYIIIGHNHPVIEMRDEMGGKWFERAWIELRGNREKFASSFANHLGSRETSNTVEDLKKTSIQMEYTKIIIVPAFNSLLGGVALNRPDTKFLGPILSSNIVEKNTAKVKLLDGTYLGSLENCSSLVRQKE
ncbi:MAG: metallophosphoesterase [Candidatus Freyarchaeum deiterrae]